MKTYPVVLSIAGSDCSGGAGIQADIKTISALGAYAASVITAVTVQNTRGVKAVHTVPAEIVQGQIEAVMEDLRPDALKIGMVSEPALVKIIAGCLLKYPHCPIVYDPVMVSTSGRKLMAEDAIQLIKEELFPLTSLITPNLDETEVLTGKKITTAEAVSALPTFSRMIVCSPPALRPPLLFFLSFGSLPFFLYYFTKFFINFHGLIMYFTCNFLFMFIKFYKNFHSPS